jgi:hypothetical protein
LTIKIEMLCCFQALAAHGNLRSVVAGRRDLIDGRRKPVGIITRFPARPPISAALRAPALAWSICRQLALIITFPPPRAP